MSKMKNKYLEEYEKYRHIRVFLREYRLRSNTRIMYEVLDIDEIAQRAILRNTKSGNIMEKTFHWCRKNLVDRTD